MSSLEAKKITPATGTTVTLGAAGDTVDVAATALKTNTIKDAGGNTILTSNGSGTLSSVNGALKGGLKFISTQTVTAGTSIEFTSGIDSTYNEYLFMLTDIHNNTNDTSFQFQFNAVGASGFNEVITSTYFYTYHLEGGAESTGLDFNTGQSQGQGTAGQGTSFNMDSEATASMAGILHLFVPSSTTYVKQFYFTGVVNTNTPSADEMFTAGYINTTAAIDEVIFRCSSGNFNGTVAMYGTGTA